jgi:hypothetical protein
MSVVGGLLSLMDRGGWGQVWALAAVEPAWTRLAVPFLGVGLFALAASFRQQRRTPVAALVVLTILLGLWMFGAGLVWSKRWPSMIRWSGSG